MPICNYKHLLPTTTGVKTFSYAKIGIAQHISIIYCTDIPFYADLEVSEMLAVSLIIKSTP
jgi:hypothetical protein